MQAINTRIRQVLPPLTIVFGVMLAGAGITMDRWSGPVIGITIAGLTSLRMVWAMPTRVPLDVERSRGHY